MASTKWMIALGGGAIALVGPAAIGQSWPFTHSYDANFLPQSPSTTPRWTKVLDSDEAGPKTSESVSNGILTVYTASKADYLEYRMDAGGGLNWNPSGAGSTLEVRLKTDFNTSGASWAGNLVIGTGSRAWTLGIGTDYISDFAGGGDLPIVTDDAFHTYRFTLTDEVNGPLALYIDGASTPAKFWPGAAGGSKRLGFGDVTTSNEGGQIQWDYIHWTNQGKFAPIAQPRSAGQPGFGRQWLRERPLTVMGEVASVTPGGYQVTPFDTNKYLGMNLNTVFVLSTPAIAEASARAGIDWHMMMDIPPSQPLTQDHKNTINYLVSRGHATAWYLPDEPQTATELQNAANYARWMNANHPDLLTYINVFQSDLGFLNNVVNTVRPDLLMFDNYPFKSDGSNDSNSWFQTLMNVRQVSQAHQIPYGGWLQSFNIPGYNVRTPSESDTRYNGYTLLTAGYSMLNYYIYDDGPATSVTSPLLDSSGNPTQMYHYAAAANQEYVTLGKTLRFLTSTDVRFVPGLHAVGGNTAKNATPSGLVDWSAGAGGDQHLISLSVASGQLGNEKNGLVGFFYDDDGQGYFMLTNLNHGAGLSAAAASLSFVLGFDSTTNELLRLNRTTGAQERLTLTNHQLNWTLPGGTGDLFKYNTGNFAGLGWCMDASGDWGDSDNWLGVIPNAVNATATFGGVLSTARTVYTDAPRTLGTLRFNSASRYNLSGNGSLTIQSSGTALIDVRAGSHKISLPLVFASDANIAVAGGASLLLSNPVTIRPGKAVTSSGTVRIEAPLTLEAGALLALAGGATTFTAAPAVAPGAAVDLRSGSILIDYGDGSSPVAAIQAQLASGYARGSWDGDGINSSTAVPGQTGLGWRDEAQSGLVIIRHAYYGDADLDGAVDLADLGALATAWQTPASWDRGDFDYSGFVDLSDLGLLASNWQRGIESARTEWAAALAALGLAGSSVPEPSLMGSMLIASTAVLRRAARRKTLQ